MIIKHLFSNLPERNGAASLEKDSQESGDYAAGMERDEDGFVILPERDAEFAENLKGQKREGPF